MQVCVKYRRNKMLKFGERKINRQGGSYIISLPMPWIQTMGTDLKTVKVEMDSENSLRIVAGDVRQDNPGHKLYSQQLQRSDEHE